MSIAVTGATGQLGRLVVEDLLRRGVAPHDIIATGRDTDRLADLAERGVLVRQADFADSAGLTEAFKGARKVLLVSTTTVGERFDNHTRAIDAAKRAGAQLIAYTSTLNAHSANMILADAHSKTERYLRDSGVPWVVLRNGWYLDNYTSQVPLYLQTGAVPGSAGTGRVSAASRRDYAEAAATVLTSEGHAGSVYELGGDTAFTLTELAAALSTASGQGVVYHDLPVEQYRSALLGAGLPAEMAEVLSDSDLGLKRGELFTASSDLRRLIGRPTTTLADALTEALGS
ncbi:NAD(P)-dependent oxidoreductase [Streptomyces antimycoticus]|uniref:NAD(P)-dependent oxidoreductase n=1 Tax=Streptomyces antimycoticus TaxID=68175 RepID=A0A499UF24_9ACTN|nr:SDR family oxidoreductase [Streptomyces antimycoticus]BBJ39903.1 NAD(P)-dependent oxidoreductase [Streptomyces antimycoticus]